KSLAFTKTSRPLTTIDSVAEDDHVWLLDRATGRARELTDGLDRRCSHLRWEADGKSVAFLVRDHGRSLIERAPAAGGPALPLFTRDATVSTFSLPQRPGRGACVLSTPMQPAEV